MEASQMKRKDMSERELARYLQEHKDDEEEWEAEPEEAIVAPRPSVVYSVRFSRAELGELRQVAADESITVSELIRTSVFAHIRESRAPEAEVVTPFADRLRFITKGLPYRFARTLAAPIIRDPQETRTQ